MDSSKHLDWPEISGSQAKLSFYFEMSGILQIPKNKFFSNLEQEQNIHNLLLVQANIGSGGISLPKYKFEMMCLEQSTYDSRLTGDT